MSAAQQTGLYNEAEAERVRCRRQHALIKVWWPTEEHVASAALRERLRSERGLRILDLAGSDGVWAAELSQVYPGHHWVTSDVKEQYKETHDAATKTLTANGSTFEFRPADLNGPYPPEWEGTFDLVHAKFAIAGTKDLAAVVREWAKLAKSGGWVQSDELDYTADYSMDGREDSAGNLFRRMIDSMLTKISGAPIRRDTIVRCFEDAHIQDVQSSGVDLLLGQAVAKSPAAKQDPSLIDESRDYYLQVMKGTSGAMRHICPDGDPTNHITPADYDALPDRYLKEMETDEARIVTLTVSGRKP